MLMETIVCSAKIGKEKRLKKLLETRIAFRKRFEACHNAWVCQSADGSGTFLVQAIYTNEEVWRKISEKIQNTLDSKDGGIESCLQGPPLVGMFIFEGQI
tara:strand:- start:661 stop:960 length:300 start_codon:yes stop_codon:yes gene_type:complete